MPSLEASPSSSEAPVKITSPTGTPAFGQQITETTAEQQEAAENQRVGIHEPVQAPL